MSLMLCITLALIAVLGEALFLPSPPDNIICFPERDFCTLQGFVDFKGSLLTVEVSRNGVGIVGSAQGIVSGNTVAFEVNHIGGVCWGQGTGLPVTPNIIPGDIVQVKSGAMLVAETQILSGSVTKSALTLGTTQSTLVLTGTYDPQVGTPAPPRISVRIVNPDLLSTDVGFRAVDAVVGPLTPGKSGNAASYRSSLTLSPGSTPETSTFTATFIFVSALTAQVAYTSPPGAFTVTMWLADVQGVAQAVTSSEFGALGGPGFGGCPMGPDLLSPASPTAIVLSNYTVKWAPAEGLLGVTPPSAYEVSFLDTSIGLFKGRSLRYSPDMVTSLTFSPTDTLINPATMTLQFRTVSATGGAITHRDVPFLASTLALPTAYFTPLAGDSTATAVEADVVTITSDTNQVVYTTDGSEPVINGSMTLASKVFNQKIVITAPVTIKAVALHTDGHYSLLLTGFYKPKPVGPPSSPTGVTGRTASNAVIVSWAPNPTDLTISYFTVSVYDTSKALVVTSDPVHGASKTFSIGGPLKALTAYTFTVRSHNAAGVSGLDVPASSVSIAFPKFTDVLVYTTGRYKLGGDLKVDGTSTFAGVTISFYNIDAAGNISPTKFAFTARAATTAVGGVYAFTVTVKPPPTLPLSRIYLLSSGGGKLTIQF